MENIGVNLAAVRAEITQSCLKAGRDSREVRLVAVSKQFPAETIKAAYTAGQDVFGENRVQELIRKKTLLPAEIEWHLIGTLQRNKVKSVLGHAALIHSVDSLALAQEISRQAVKKGTEVKILLQANISGEKSKHGFTPRELLINIKEISALPGIKIRGLMTIAPLMGDPEQARPVFSGLRALAGQIRELELPGVEMRELSMGMSDDFRVAVEEGATLVRIGSRLFGRRVY